MALDSKKSGFGFDLEERFNKDKSAAKPAPVVEKVKPDRINLRFEGTNGDYVRKQAKDREAWPGGVTQYINWLIEQDRAKNGE